MDVRRRAPLRAINQQENLLVGAKAKQTQQPKRAVLGDISSNVRTTLPTQSLKASIKQQNDEIQKPAKVVTRSYKNVSSKIDTGIAPNKLVNKENEVKSFIRSDAATKTDALLSQLRQAKISAQIKVKTSSRENTATKESNGVSAQKFAIADLAFKKKSDVSIRAKRKTESYSTELLEEVEDIDAGDGTNPILMGVYIKDIYNYLMDLEVEYPIKENHLDGQICMTPNMRAMLVDWLVEVHEQFSLMLETLHLTVAIFDRYSQEVKTIQRKHIQLVGITSMFIASKYEEMFMPDIQDFVYITDNLYTKADIMKCEKQILQELKFSLGRPLPLHFERRFIKAAKVQVKNHLLAKYLIDLCLVEYEMAHFRPSEVAAAAVCLSLTLLSTSNGPPEKYWTGTLVYYTGYKFQKLAPIVKKIANIVINSSTSKYRAVTNKYRSSKYGKVSEYQQLKGDLIRSIAEGSPKS